MSTHIISEAEAIRDSSLIFNRVHYQGEHYEIKRDNEIIAQIIPIDSKRQQFTFADLKKLFESLPSIDDEDRLAFEADSDVKCVPGLSLFKAMLA